MLCNLCLLEKMGAVVALNIERSLRIEIDFRSFRHQIFACFSVSFRSRD